MVTYLAPAPASGFLQIGAFERVTYLLAVLFDQQVVTGVGYFNIVVFPVCVKHTGDFDRRFKITIQNSSVA